MRRAVLWTLFAVSLFLIPAGARAGTLDLVGSTPIMAGVDGLVLSPDGAELYTVTRQNGTITVLARDASTGLLTKVQTISALFGAVGTTDARAIVISPDGKHAYVATRAQIAGQKDGVSIWARDLGTGTLTYLGQQSEGVGGVSGLDDVTSLLVSTDGLHVYARGRSGADAAIAGFARDATTGALTFLGATTFASGASGGAHGIAITADGSHVYAVGDDAVVAFARDGGSGALTQTSIAQNGVGGIAGLNKPTNVTVSADGAHVYVVAPGTSGAGNDELVVLARDPGTGALTYVERHHESRPARGPADLALDHSGKRLFVAAAFFTDGALDLYDRNPATGRLALAVAATGTSDMPVGSPRAVAVSPDDVYVYVADGETRRVLIFETHCGNGVIETDEECDDGNLRNGDGCNASCYVERCYACAGAPSACAPNDGASCWDGNECTASDTCMGGVCAGTPDDGASCDDRDVCTIGDTCAGGACAGVAEPEVGCRQPLAPGTTSLALVDIGGVDVQWKWKGQQTTVGDLGDPVSGATQYTACVYEQTGPLLNLEADVCPSEAPCWRSNARGARLKSRGAIAKLMLKAGRAGKASILMHTRVKPVPGGLPLAPPVTVQLKAWHWGVSGGGEIRQTVDTCWGAAYGSPKKNDVFGFKAKND